MHPHPAERAAPAGRWIGRSTAPSGSAGDPLERVDPHGQQLALLDVLRVRRRGVDLGVEEEPAVAELLVGVDDAAGFLVLGDEAGLAAGEQRAVEARDDAAAARV